MKSLTVRALVYGFLILLGALFATPSVLPEDTLNKLPDWYAKQHVSLGLDLRGGSQLLLALDEKGLLKQEHQRMGEEFSRTLRKERIAFGRIQSGEKQIVIPLRDAARAQEAAAAIKPILKDDTSLTPKYTLEVVGSEVRVQANTIHRQALLDDAIERSLEVVRRRLNESGLVEPSILRQGRDSILVQMPGVEDPASIRKLLGTTAQMSFHWVYDAKSQGGRITLPVLNRDPDAPKQEMTLEAEVSMKGEHIRDAQLGFNQQSGQPVVNFRLDGSGAQLFGKLTAENVGRAFAIVLDNQIVTAPVIRSVIAGGSGEISGSFTSQEASQVALLLRSGALPAPLTVVEERTIGPDLGSDAINMGLSTGVLGFILVVLFVMVAYGRWGLVASVALVLNIVITFGILALFGATLTLPGIAGLILSVGMAVDANILINERIREESRAGRSPRMSLNLGFDNAYRTIIDSNVTTLVAVALLFMFGAGPVRGFAVTIAIGLMSSMFTAVAVTRLIMEWAINRKPKPFRDLPLHRFIQQYTNKPLNILKGRVAGLATSATLSIASIILLFTMGLNYGIDFEGGTLLEAHLPGSTTEDVRHQLESNGFNQVALQELGESSQYLLRLPVAKEQAADGKNELADAVKAKLSETWPDAKYPRLEMVGAKVSGEFGDLTIIAIIVAGLGMLAYLWLRFESHFALAATLTIALDLTKTIGFFCLVGVEFNLTAVAAILALMGYSVNDKVVVFDRIRENLRLHPEMKFIDILNDSITSTLTRTLFTSLSTVFALLPMTIAGGPAVASFAQPMMFGIVVGTSSSIFVAAPILYYLGMRRERKGLPQLRKTKEELQKELDLIP